MSVNDQPFVPIVLKSTKTEDGTAVEVEMEPVFELDGDLYQIPAKPSAGLALGYLEKQSTLGADAAVYWMMVEMLGAEGFEALRDHPDLEREQMDAIISHIEKKVLGAVPGGKVPWLSSAQDQGQVGFWRTISDRLAEVGWVWLYLEDVESDLSALHRIEPEDVDSLSAYRFFSLALRLMHYQGAVRGRMEFERDNPSQALTVAPSESTAPAAVAPREANPHLVSGTKDSSGKTYYSDISHNPELAQYFD
ncbi:tail assembly chaperone [Streptomyces phage Zuko]|uniref:Tail assembly chaperone n=1 Tax=Streptomyces phage Zuko TaxID=2601695 RepID=A0A5J6D728_9CAUD|nr:tail assembly chaperone [Streptomyces phage Zuko]QEQ93599.1 tail assembly chaperone [Streptomyces phage Zuko]